MALTVTIGGVDVTSQVRWGSGAFSIEQTLNARHLCDLVVEDQVFDVGDVGTLYRPALLAELTVDDGPTRVFGGLITAVQEFDWAVPYGIATKVSAADYTLYADRIESVEETYAAGQTLKQVVSDLRTTYLDQFGVTLDAGMLTGPTLEAQVYGPAARLTDVLNHLSAITGWIWTIDASKVLKMWAPGTVAAPASLVEGSSSLAQLQWSRTVEGYCNRQIVRIGQGQAGKSETFTGDGVTKTFPLTYPLAVVPGYVTVLPGPLYQTVAIYGSGDVASWYYRASDNAMVQDAGGAALTGSQTLTVDYTAQFPMVVTAEDAAEIAARGVWERTTTAPEVFDKAAGEEIAAGLLRRRKGLPKHVPLVLWTAGYLPGQTVTVTWPSRGLSGSYLITDVRISDDGGMRLEYGLSLVEADELAETFRDFWLGLGGGGGGSVSGGATGGGTSVVVTGAFWAYLGGSRQTDVTHSAAVDVPDYVDVVLDSSRFAGVPLSVRCQVKTLSAGTSVQPRLWNVTDGTVAGAGSATTATSWEDQVFAVTLASGIKRYRLQLVPGNASAGVLGIGALEA